MNIIKALFILVTGASVGVGMDYLSSDAKEKDTTPYYSETHCHNDSDTPYFFTHYDDESKALIEEKFYDLLDSYDTTLEEFYDDHSLRHDIMDEIHKYIEENNFTFEEDNYYRHRHHRWRYQEGDTE